LIIGNFNLIANNYLFLDSTRQSEEQIEPEGTLPDSLEYMSIPEVVVQQDESFGVLVAGGVGITTIENFTQNSKNIVGFGILDFGVVFDKTYYLGISLNNLSFAKIESNYIDTNLNSRPILGIEYYGLEFGAVIYDMGQLKIHFNTSVSSGLIEYKVQSSINENNNTNSTNYTNNYGSDDFVVFEPKLFLTINTNQWARVVFGLNYRVPFGLDYTFQNDNYTNANIGGIGAIIKLQFGDLWF